MVLIAYCYLLYVFWKYSPCKKIVINELFLCIISHYLKRNGWWSFPVSIYLQILSLFSTLNGVNKYYEIMHDGTSSCRL